MKMSYNTNQEPKTPRPFHIIQYNMHRSRDAVMAAFLRDPRALEADIIAAQEPWNNPYNDTTHHPAKKTHQLLYPYEEDTGARARVCLFIHKRIKTASWHHEAFSRDYQTIRIAYFRGGTERGLIVHNVYN